MMIPVRPMFLRINQVVEQVVGFHLYLHKEAEFDPSYVNYEETERIGLLDDGASSTAGYTGSAQSRSSVLIRVF